jgi:MscS family membrane protein
LEYGYTPERLEACAAQIRALLKRDGTVESGSAIVALDSLGDSGPVYKVICCTNQTDYGDFLLERGRLYGEILRILEKEKINLAYPTSAVLVKKQTPPGKGGASV